MALHWHLKKRATDFKGFYVFLIAKRAEKDDFSQKSDEDGLRPCNLHDTTHQTLAQPHSWYVRLTR